eukprot:CAMPEP_0170245736 /NCGR_PEP_ID=MMETSP0116_2-20130129/22653_1 /TAXON_ID=400756 /ORGANISM="Durinskia baltica, Strain CSIRO CS-38" /LENGTH=195 /DNA_ID=CAMNT_0010496609 /DNA_START=125 /DNA_END=713 /DNA_ORIENTATION=+
MQEAGMDPMREGSAGRPSGLWPPHSERARLANNRSRILQMKKRAIQAHETKCLRRSSLATNAGGVFRPLPRVAGDLLESNLRVVPLEDMLDLPVSVLQVEVRRVAKQVSTTLPLALLGLRLALLPRECLAAPIRTILNPTIGAAVRDLEDFAFPWGRRFVVRIRGPAGRAELVALAAPRGTPTGRWVQGAQIHGV